MQWENCSKGKCWVNRLEFSVVMFEVKQKAYLEAVVMNVVIQTVLLLKVF